MAKKSVVKKDSERLLDIRNLKIEATVYPPGEEPRTIIIVDGVSLTLNRGRVLGLIGESAVKAARSRLHGPDDDEIGQPHPTVPSSAGWCPS